MSVNYPNFRGPFSNGIQQKNVYLHLYVYIYEEEFVQNGPMHLQNQKHNSWFTELTTTNMIGEAINYPI